MVKLFLYDKVPMESTKTDYACISGDDFVRGIALYNIGAKAAAVETSGAHVYGSVWEVKPHVIAAVDRHYGVPHFYQRVRVSTAGGHKAFAYVMASRYLPRGSKPLADGDWEKASEGILKALADVGARYYTKPRTFTKPTKVVASRSFQRASHDDESGIPNWALTRISELPAYCFITEMELRALEGLDGDIEDEDLLGDLPPWIE